MKNAYETMLLGMPFDCTLLLSLWTRITIIIAMEVYAFNFIEQIVWVVLPIETFSICTNCVVLANLGEQIGILYKHLISQLQRNNRNCVECLIFRPAARNVGIQSKYDQAVDR